jgi:RNA polymerase sigma-70 factor (ECF subfamily)
MGSAKPPVKPCGEMPTSELVALAQAGDRRKFDELVERFGSMVRALITYYLGPADAEDMAQNIWLLVYQKLWQLDTPEKFAAWLKQLVFYQCLNYRKSRATTREREVYLSEEGWLTVAECVADDAENVEDLIQARETRLLVDAALAALPPEYGALLRLYYLEGLSYGEIVELTGLPQGTIKWRMHAGRELLKRELTQVLVLSRRVS